MRDHTTFFGRIFGTAWDSVISFFKKKFKDADHGLLEVAITVTNVVKQVLSSGAANFLVSLTPTDIDDKLLATLNKQLPIILANEIMIQGINQASTEEEVKSVFSKVLDSFGLMTDADKEQFYTSIAAKIYIVFQELKSGKKISFGEAALLVESAYQEWLNSK